MLMHQMLHDDDHDDHDHEDPFEIIRQLEAARRRPTGGIFGGHPTMVVEPIRLTPHVVHIGDAHENEGLHVPPFMEHGSHEMPHPHHRIRDDSH